MIEVDVLNLKAEKVGNLTLKKEVFGVEPNEHVVWEAVRSYLASVRSGNHSTLRRSEVRGGGRKPYKQKGTGRARQGSNRSPNFVGGGKVFGPKPRDYSYAIPRKAKALAISSILSSRASEKKIFVFEDFSMERPKTKTIVQLLKSMDLNKTLVVGQIKDECLIKSVRNLEKVKFLAADHLNAYDLVNFPNLIINVEGVRIIEEQLVRQRALLPEV